MRIRKTKAERQSITVLTGLFIMTLAVMCCIIFSSTKTQAAPAETSYKYYTSIQVQKGDTLWNIANEYMTEEYASVSEYIDEVCEINHIADSDIHYGQYLTIPYYSGDYME